ncbi:MAG: lipid-A-disaccharide synthase-related protein, partial [Synechococcus sp.]|nr:lipid-A-disaccharide synthase-related protein [Synechococcus sp.]
YLVAYSSHYEGRLRLPWPCGACLASGRTRAVFSRDALSASDLSEQLRRQVQFLGNPFMEGIAEAQATGPRAGVLLLPGSRLPEARENLARMLALLEQLPTALAGQRFSAALVRELDSTAVAELALQRGWQLEPGESSSNRLVLRRGTLRLEGHWGRFATLLPQAQVVISMAGTASEQAVGLGIPVLQLAGHGPQFTAGFAEAQRRLLGPAVHCAAGAVDDPATLRASAQLLEQLLTLPEQELARYRQEGLQRLGSSGGTERMAQAILEALTQG